MHIIIDSDSQTLQLLDENKVLFSASISTAKNGLGEKGGSECTPRGWHTIRAMIGENEKSGSVFVGRRATGEIVLDENSNEFEQHDWITSRILWLSGLELGVNRLSSVDTMRRYIYIHGTPYENELGQAVSHGCIRMKNSDVIKLYGMVSCGTHVLITGTSNV